MKQKIKYLVSIDGSTTKTGISVFNIDTKELVLHTFIAPENPKKSTKKMTKDEKKAIKKENMDYRINEMITEINKVFKDYAPKVIYMEDTYGGKDMYAYKKLCHLQGLVLNYSLTHSSTLLFKTPSAWRKDVGIPVSEDKIKLERETLKQKAIDLVKKEYGIDVCDDEAESICLGLSYFANKGIKKKELL